MSNKKIYALQTLENKQNIPRAFDLHLLVSQSGKSFISTNNGFLYHIIAKNDERIHISIEKQRNPNDYPHIRNTKTQKTKSMREKLEPHEILAEKGRCTIFRNGLIIIEYNQHAGGIKLPIESLIKELASENSVKISNLYDQIILEEYIKSIKKGELSFEVSDASKLFDKYELGSQNIVRQKIILQFKNGDNIFHPIKEMLAAGVAKIKSVKNKGNNGRAMDCKGNNITQAYKEIKHYSEDDQVFHLMEEYKKELNMNKYLVMVKDQLILLDDNKVL